MVGLRFYVSKKGIQILLSLVSSGGIFFLEEYVSIFKSCIIAK